MPKIIELTSSITCQAKGFPAYLQVKVNEFIELDSDEVGIIEGRHSFHQKGVGIFGGIVNPNWSGQLTIEFTVFGDIEITKGEKIAHVIILK